MRADKWHEIIALGQQLVDLSTIEDQSNLIVDFVNNKFNCSLFLVLINSSQKLYSSVAIPSTDHELVIKKIKKTLQPVHSHNKSSLFLLGLPLLHQDQLFGVMIISKHNSKFNDDEQNALESLSSIASIALFATIQSQLEEIQQQRLALVHNVTKELVLVRDLNSLTSKICHLIQNTFNYYYVAVFTLEANKNDLIFRASARAQKSDQPLFEFKLGSKIKLGDHIVGSAAQSGELILSNDVNKEPLYGHLEPLPETQSEIALPLIISSQVLGVLDVQANLTNAFDENDVLLLKVLADNIAIAIHRVRLYDEAQEHAEQLSAISEVSQAITLILDPDDLLDKVVKLIHQHFGFPFIHIFLNQPDKHSIIYKAGYGNRSDAYKDAQVAYDYTSEKGIVSFVAREGTHVLINDVTEDVRFIPNPITNETSGSELTLPLLFGNQVLGVLDIQSDQVDAFTQEDLSSLLTLSSNIAIAVRNSKLYRSEIWRRQVAESLKEVAIQISKNVSLDQILNEILDEIQRILPSDGAAIWLFDEELVSESTLEHPLGLNTFRFAESFDINNDPIIVADQLSWFYPSLSQGIPLIRQVGDLMDPLSEKLGLAAEHSSIAAPLIVGGRTLGLLTLYHHETGRYGVESQSITASFAGFTGIAIDNTQLFRSSQEQAWISTVLLQVAQATQSLTSIPELVSTVVRLTPLLVGIEGCGLFLRESDTDLFLLHDLYGNVFSEDYIKQPLPIDDSTLLSDLILTHTPVLVDDPKAELNLPDSICLDLANKTLVVLPLVTHNDLLGAFLVIQDTIYSEENNKDILEDERLAIIQGITQQTAVAVENIRLLNARQEEAYISAVLLQVAQEIVSNANLDDILESIVHILPVIVGIDCCIIYLWDSNSEQFFPSHVHWNSNMKLNLDDILEQSYIIGDFPLLDIVKSKNKPFIHPFETALNPDDWDLIIPDDTISDFKPILNSQYGLLMGFPLSVKGEIFGVLITQELSFNQNREKRFDLIQGIAQQASLAIQNDHLNKERIDRERVDREFQLAREIQRTFLPEYLPDIEGFESDFRWTTARQVGGDFYDIFKRSETQYGITIADVSDKGLAASLYMTVARTLLRAVALESDSTAKTLERVNDLFLLDSQNGFFVTFFYAILDIQTGIIQYTNAGHNPPYLLQANTKKVISLEQGGIAIGAMPNIHLPEIQLLLEPGDCLVLHTDGVTEAQDNKGNFYGENRYKLILRKGIGLSTHETLDLIDTALDKFRHGAQLSDDTTLLALKRKELLTY
ncbi:MAG: GAF domain-containing protein [Anaerolineaceae bacterium]|nr:GAF domain-containing protein [Anaerolineaceae bacterium]